MKDFEDYLKGVERRGAVKRSYTDQDKKKILIEVAPLILNGTPVKLAAALAKVPYLTLYVWIKRINSEGLSSLENKVRKRGEDGLSEMQKAVDWIKISGKKPTPKQFREAAFYLRLKRKPFSLYLYYRRSVNSDHI